MGEPDNTVVPEIEIEKEAYLPEHSHHHHDHHQHAEEQSSSGDVKLRPLIEQDSGANPFQVVLPLPPRLEEVATVENMYSAIQSGEITEETMTENNRSDAKGTAVDETRQSRQFEEDSQGTVDINVESRKERSPIEQEASIDSLREDNSVHSSEKEVLADSSPDSTGEEVSDNAQKQNLACHEEFDSCTTYNNQPEEAPSNEVDPEPLHRNKDVEEAAHEDHNCGEIVVDGTSDNILASSEISVEEISVTEETDPPAANGIIDTHSSVVEFKDHHLDVSSSVEAVHTQSTEKAEGITPEKWPREDLKFDENMSKDAVTNQGNLIESLASVSPSQAMTSERSYVLESASMEAMVDRSAYCNDESSLRCELNAPNGDLNEEPSKRFYYSVNKDSAGDLNIADIQLQQSQKDDSNVNEVSKLLSGFRVPLMLAAVAVAIAVAGFAITSLRRRH